MKNKQLQLAPALSILALILAVSGNPALPDTSSPILQIPPVEQEVPEGSRYSKHEEQSSSTDIDKPITTSIMVEKYDD